ncbi:MAG: GLPGLI family protein, partial [Flavobacteriales bacterium]
MKWMFSACLVLACTAPMAQQNAGVVTYEEAFNLDAELNVEEEGGEDPFADMPPEIVEQIKAAMATLPTNKKQLLFSPAATVMSNVIEEEKATPPGQNMARVMIMVDSDQGNDIIHHDLASGKVTEQRELLDKKFLIERENDELAWKITGNQKQLLDQLVIEATTTLDSAEVVAWFAPLIPVSSGPQG